MKKKRISVMFIKRKWYAVSDIMEKIVQDLKTSYQSRIYFEIVDYDIISREIRNCNFNSYPAICFKKDEEILEIMTGLISKKEIEDKLNFLLRNNY